MPDATYFKPRGIPLRALAEVVLTTDELEALRLADLEGHYQESAAEQMGVSRPTFGRIVGEARRKVAEFLIAGTALRIEGGKVTVEGQRKFECQSCHHAWHMPFGTGRPAGCPACGSEEFHRTDGGGGCGGGHGGKGKGRCHRTRHHASSAVDLPVVPDNVAGK